MYKNPIRFIKCKTEHPSMDKRVIYGATGVVIVLIIILTVLLAIQYKSPQGKKQSIVLPSQESDIKQTLLDQCYQNMRQYDGWYLECLAFASNDPAKCEFWDDPNMKGWCKGLAAQDPSYCDDVDDSFEDKFNCYLDASVATADCSKAPSEDMKRECEAFKSNDIANCEFAKEDEADLWEYYECQARVKKDPSPCDSIEDPGYRLRCRSIISRNPAECETFVTKVCENTVASIVP